MQHPDKIHALTMLWLEKQPCPSTPEELSNLYDKVFEKISGAEKPNPVPDYYGMSDSV